MNDNRKNDPEGIPYHHNSYMYHTGNLDSAIRSHNILFWYEAFKNNCANLSTFCFVHNLSASAASMLKELNPSRLSLLINPVNLDFEITFKQPLEKILNVSLDELKRNVRNMDRAREISVFGTTRSEFLEADIKSRRQIGLPAETDSMSGEAPNNSEKDQETEPAEGFDLSMELPGREREIFRIDISSGSGDSAALEKLMNTGSGKKFLGVEHVKYRVDPETVFQILGKGKQNNVFNDLFHSGFNLVASDQDAVFLSYSQFNKFCIIQTIRDTVRDYPLEIFRLGISLENARIIAALPYESVLALVRSGDFKLKLRYNSRQLELILGRICEIEKSESVRFMRQIYSWLELISCQLMMEDRYRSAIAASAEKNEDDESHTGASPDEGENYGGRTAENRHKNRVSLFDASAGGSGNSCLAHETVSSVKAGSAQKKVYQRINCEHENRARFYLLNGIPALTVERDAFVSPKILRRLERDLKLEYPMWKDNYKIHASAHFRSMKSHTFELALLHRNFIACAYFKLRALTEGFTFNRIDYAIVLYHYYMMNCDHYRYSDDCDVVYRLIIKEICKVIRDADKGEGQLMHCQKCFRYFYRHAGSKDTCPYCYIRRRFFEKAEDDRDSSRNREGGAE